MRIHVSQFEGGFGKRTRENNEMQEKIRRRLNMNKFGFWIKIL